MRLLRSFLFFVAAAAAFGAPLPRETILARAATRGDAVWASTLDPAKSNPRMSELMTYALLLCETRQHPERLAKLFELTSAVQDLDRQSKTYGNFRWLGNDTDVKDLNAVEFTMQPAAVLWLRHRATMPAEAREKLRAVLEPAVAGSLSHRVSDGYTNIAVMSASNLIMLGEGLDRRDVADEGYKRLQAVFDVTLRGGIREYVSPDYYGVDLDALHLAAEFAQRPAGKRQAQALVELFWTDIAAHFWVPNGRLGGAHGRNYDYLHGIGGLDRQLSAAGWIEGGQLDSVASVISAVARWTPPPALVEMNRTRLPRLVRQMWGGAPLAQVTSGAPAAPPSSDGKVWAAVTHWLGRDVALSVGGKNYGPIDIPMAVDLPGPRESVRCFFLPDGRGDAYGKSKIPWRGHPKAVHLQPFFAAVQETQDALALVVYRDTDILPECTSLHSHFVMPLAVDAIYVGDEKVEFRRGAAKSIALEAGRPVFLRQGGAVVAVRVPQARTVAGAPAPVALVWDDNEWGAIRVTVDHQLGATRSTAAAAVFQVSVGSELDDAGFAQFRRAFAGRKCELTWTPTEIAVQAPANKAALALGARAPWAQPTRLEPAPPRVVLEIDGEDHGRKILTAAQ
jgi:hypothetical protein